MSRNNTDDWTYGQGSSAPGKGRDLDGEAIKTLLSQGYSMDAIVRLMQDGKLRSTSRTSGISVDGSNAVRTQVGGKLVDFASSVIPGLSERLSAANNRNITPARDAPYRTSDSSRLSQIRKATAAAQKVKELIGNSKGGKRVAGRQSDSGKAGGGLGGVEDTGGGFEPGVYTPPVISARDFTQQANDLAAQAYGPMYSAIDMGKQNASGQFNTSDAVVKGLYEKLGADIAASKQQQAASYAQAGTDAGSRYADLQKTLGANYQAAAQQESDLMAQNGSQAAASDVIPDDRAFMQNQAATQGAATQDYFAKQGQAEQDYMAKLGAAGAQEGNVQRQELVKQLAGVLNQYDQQAVTLQGQQSQTAMDIGNKLTDRDLSVQQANAGYGLDAWNANQNAALGAAQLQQQASNTAYDRSRDSVADQQFNRQQELAENKYRLDAAGAVADAQGGSGGLGLEFNQLPPQQQVVAQADQLAGGQGQRYFDFINKFMQDQLAKSPSAPDSFNTNTFANAVAQAAAAQGLQPAIAMAIAGSYWHRIMNRS